MGSSSTRRLFSDEETQDHINVLELKAILLALAHHIRLAYIKILCDNSTAVVCINKLLENVTPYANKFGNGHSKMKIGSWPHTFQKYKTQRQTSNLERMRSILSGKSGKIYLAAYARN